MNNLRKSAPYLYLTRASQQGSYVIFMLVPLDSSANVVLSGVSPTDQGDHYQIAYSTTNDTTPDTYRLMHWTVVKGNRQYIKAVGNGSADLTMKLYFDSADTEIAAPGSDHSQRQAPYIFLGKETVGARTFVRPSCIVLFDALVGKEEEAISFDEDNCTYVINCGVGGALATNAANFVINQDLRTEMTGQMPYFEATVEHNIGIVGLAPAEGGKKKRKVATHTPTTAMPNGRTKEMVASGDLYSPMDTPDDTSDN